MRGAVRGGGAGLALPLGIGLVVIECGMRWIVIEDGFGVEMTSIGIWDG